MCFHGGSGISVEDLQRAIEEGIANIHVNTDIRVAYTVALKKSLEDNPDEVAPYKIFPPVVQAVQEVVEEKLKLFKSVDRL